MIEKLNHNKTLARVIEYLEYLFVFGIIAECNSMYTFTRLTDKYTSMDDVFLWMTLGLLIVLLAARGMLNWRSLGKLKGYALICLLVLALETAFFFLNVRARLKTRQQDYIEKFVVFLPLLILLFKLKQQEGKGLDLLYKHSNITCVIAALSLLVYLSSIFHVNTMPSDAIYTWWSNSVHMHERINLLNVCQFVTGAKWQIRGISLLRNFGFYTEPLMFSIPLITALCTELFLRGRRDPYSIYRAMLLSLALLSANATICVILMAIVWGLKGISGSLERKKRWLAALIVCAMLAACVLMVVEKKMLSYETTEVSGSSLADHIEDYRASFKAFLNKPLLGGGYLKDSYIRKFMDPTKVARNPGLSNTAGLILGEGGLLFGLLCLMPFAIGLLHVFRKRDWNMAFWTVGPLGLCVGVIFTYRFYLLFVMAFGYSLLEIRKVEGKRFPYRVGFVDFGTRDEAGAAAEVRKPKRLRVAALRNAGIFALACALVVWLGVPVWQMIYGFLRSHQFSMSQSPLKSFCLNTVLLYQGCSLYAALHRQLSWKRVIALALWDAAFLLAYPKLYSDTVTLLTAAGLTEQLYECAIILCAYYVGAGLVLHFQPKECLNLRRSAVAYGVIIVAVVLFAVAQVRIGEMARAEDALSEPLRQLTDSASGAVYVTDQPSVAHRLNGNVSLVTTKKSGYDVCGNTSVVYKKGSNRPELFEKGFQVAMLTDKYLIYSNDADAIAALTAQGLDFYRYYPYDTAVSLKTLAQENNLERTEDGALSIGGGNNYLAHGPFETLRKGQYTIRYELSIDPDVYAGVAADKRVCTLQVSRYTGKETIAQKKVTLSQFDEAGHAVVDLPFTLATVSDGVEYKLSGSKKRAVRLDSLKLKQTPDYITVTTYNCYRNTIREEYYDIEGLPYVKPGGYAAVEWDYALGDLLIGHRCFGKDGKPVLNGSGYAEARFGYSNKRMRNYEAYYGIDGQPVMISGKYASIRTDYDTYGNVNRIRYFDTKGNLTVSSSGYAELLREYNSKMQLTKETYLDANELPLVQTSGYSAMAQEFDDEGNVSRRWYLQDDTPVSRTDGYAEVRWKYNKLHQVIREEYYNENAEPVMVFNGYAAIEREYDEAGNIITYRYYDTDQQPTVISSGYAQLRRVYNNKRQIVKEAYYDIEGQPMLGLYGYASFERVYNEDASIQEQRYFGLNGEPVFSFDGYHVFKREFDNEGRISCERYFDTEDNPTLCSKGFASVRKSYNDQGLVAEETFFDIQDNPTVANDGYTKVRYEYAEDGQQLLAYYLDESGDLAQIGSGYFHEYLQSLIGKDVVVFISAKDEATNGLTDTLRADLKALGIQTDLRGRTRNSFYAVITADGVIEDIGTQGVLSTDGMIGDTPYTITSAGYQVGNFSSILIDGIEYSKNRRGMNIAVYDINENRVIDSVVFDTYLQEIPVMR